MITSTNKKEEQWKHTIAGTQWTNVKKEKHLIKERTRERKTRRTKNGKMDKR